jgi:beta-galactosidase
MVLPLRVSRRQFLKTTGGVAALAAIPRLLGASIAARAPGASGDDATRQRFSEGWEFFKGSLGGPWEVWHSSEVAAFEPATMPHCFNAYDGCDPDTAYYRGPGWYRTKVKITNPFPGGRTLLHFEGAGQTTSLFVNSHLVGKHLGGYDEFVFDITDAMNADSQKTGDPSIAVLCDNSRDLDRIPSDLSDFSLYGGLYRHVNLIYMPATSLDHVHITTQLPNARSPAHVTVAARLYNPAKLADPLTVTVSVKDAAGAAIHESTQTLPPWEAMSDLATFVIEQPKLWSPVSPHLYGCEVQISSVHGESSVVEEFGARKIEFVDHGPFLLNGERLLLRGTHRHEDHAGYAAAMPDDLIERELKLIRDMGANFIRLAHYQQSPLVLWLCDHLGLLVWEELPWCRGGVGDDAFRQMARDKLTAMIDQHYNHPSLILWGLGNEDDWPGEYPELDQAAIRDFMQQLNELAHQLDPSRSTSFRRCDFARDIPDVYSPSIWAGWYSGTYQEYQAALETQRERVKHFVHIEWGADSHARRHSEDPDRVLAEIATGHGTAERGLAYLNEGGPARVSKDGDWSETYACNLFDWHLKVQETLPWFTGSAMWIFKDFTTPLRVENPVPRVNQKGVIERDMTLKESYYVFQSYWSPVPMAHIYGHSWPVRWGDVGEQKLVKVYSNCKSAELFLNGASIGVKHRDSQDFPAAGLRWLVPFRAGTNHLRVVATAASGSIVTDELDFTYQTERWSKPAALTLVEKSRTTGRITVVAKLFDDRGALCLDARNQVRFTLAGDGELIDNLGTSNGSRLVQLYNGRAEITVRQPKGRSTVGVSAQGIPSAFVAISA